MAEKEIAFNVKLNGVSAEAQQLAQIELNLKKVTKERNDYVKLLQEVEKVGGKVNAEQVKELAALNTAVKKQNEEYRNLKKVVDTSASSLDRMRAKLAEMKKAANSGSAELRAKMTPEIKKLNDEISKAEQAQGTFTRNVGNYGAAFETLPGPLGRAANGVRQLSVAFKALLANPVVLIITAIVGALAALVKAFKSTDSGGTEFIARFEQIKAILDVVRQRLVSVTQAIGHVFKGEWKQAGQAFKESVKGIGDQMRSATRAAYDYQYALDAVGDAENNYLSQSAINRSKIARLEYTAQDRRRSTEERRKALIEAMEIGEEELRIYQGFAREKLDAEIAYLAGKAGLRSEEVFAFIEMTDAEQAAASQSLRTLRNNNEDKFAEIEKLYAAWIDLDTRFYEEQKRNISRLSGFEEEQRKAREAAEQKASQERLTALVEAEQQRLADEAFMASLEAEVEKAYQEEIRKAKEETAEIEQQIGEDAIEATKERHAELLRLEQDKENKRMEIVQASLSGLQSAANASFNARKSRLQAEMQAELNNENLTQQQKIAIQKRYARQQQKIDTRQAIINMALAIGNALATVRPFIPAGVAAAGLAAIEGGAQITAIKTQKFAKGGKITGGVKVNTGTVDDTLIVANKTETVLTADHVRKLGGSGVMKSIGVPGYAMGGYIGQQAPEIPSAGMDMDRLASMINAIEVRLDIHKVNSAQREVEVVTTRQAI